MSYLGGLTKGIIFDQKGGGGDFEKREMKAATLAENCQKNALKPSKSLVGG